MSAGNWTQLSILENQAFALMGRMHVILRRQNGRVTDIEYMRIDPDYCRYLLDMAAQLPNEDLRQICTKLDEIYFGSEGLFVRMPPKPPLLTRLAAQPPMAKPVAPSIPQQAETSSSETAPLPEERAGVTVDRTYIGRLR